MAYSVSSLPAYTKQPAKPLLYAKLFDLIPTLAYCNLQTGIKSAETLELLDSTAYWQTQACSFSASGADTLTQRTLTVGKPMVQKSFCERTLESKYTQQALKAGGNYTSLAYNTEIIDNTLQNVRKNIEKSAWLGQVGSGTHYLGHYDGFATIINAISDIANRTYSGTTWSEANSRTVIKGLVALIVANDDVYQGGDANIKLFMSPKMAQEYRWKRATDNIGFDGAYDQDNKGKLYAEGTNIEIVETPGLTGTNYIYAIEPENMFFGTDMQNEYEKFKVWYSEDNMEIRMHLEFKAGFQVAFTDRCFRYLGV